MVMSPDEAYISTNYRRRYMALGKPWHSVLNGLKHDVSAVK